MKTNLGSAVNSLAALAFCATIAAVAPCARASAQDDRQDQTRIKLAIKVHLILGVTTVDTVMAALSEQTGLDIKAADYLCERKLTVRMDNISAAAALEALDGLNDWTWSNVQQGQILVTRRRLHLDAVRSAVPRQMQAAIPKDMRTYLHFLTPSEDMTKYINSLEAWGSLDPRDESNKLVRTIITDQTDLITSLAPGILTGAPAHFGKLTQEQRSDLLVALVFPLLRDTPYVLLHGDILPHVADVNNAFLQMSGKTTLMILSIIKNDKAQMGMGFGAQIR